MIDRGNDLAQLPKGWVWTQLGDISDVILGQSPPSSTYNEKGNGLPFYQGKLEFGKIYPTPRKWCTAPKKVAEKDDVLISVRAPVGPTNICPEKSCIGRGLAAIRGLGGIESPFILYLIRAFENVIAGKGTGTTFNAITGDQLKQFRIHLAPINEQRRIVVRVEELFSRLDAGVESLRKVKAQLKRYRQAVLKYAFEGKLTEEWRRVHSVGSRKQISDLVLKSHQDIVRNREKSGKRTYGKLEPLQYEKLPQIPNSWVWARFEEVIYVIDYRGRTPPFSPDGVPHLRSSNIRDGNIVWDNLEYVSDETYQECMVRGLPEESDLLFTTEAPLGEVAPVPNRKFSVAQRVVILRPTRYLMNPKFLLYQIMSERFKRRLTGRGTGTTVTGVSYRNLRQVETVVPPLDEQELIVQNIENRMSIIEKVASSVDESLTKAAYVRSGILKRAFEGRLIPQDPSDEPADRLLERIRKERQKRETETKKSDLRQMELIRYVK